MDDIEQLCSRVLILRSGELIYDGQPGGLTREGERRLRVRFVQPVTADDLASCLGVPANLIELEKASEEKESPPVHITIKQDQIVPVLQALLGRYSIVDMGIEEQSLENVIQRLYAEERAL
jgi:ABC-type uncharacterized transport system ATPase subunit